MFDFFLKEKNSLGGLDLGTAKQVQEEFKREGINFEEPNGKGELDMEIGDDFISVFNIESKNNPFLLICEVKRRGQIDQDEWNETLSCITDSDLVKIMACCWKVAWPAGFLQQCANNLRGEIQNELFIKRKAQVRPTLRMVEIVKEKGRTHV